MNSTKLSRREALLLMGCASCGVDQPRGAPESSAGQELPKPFRLAICNETFQGWGFLESCRGALRTGYTGLEIAPFTLAEDPAAIPAAQRKEYRDILEGEGLGYVGLHSLLTVPRGELHITTPEDSVRDRSWEYFGRLIDLCADLGDNGLMILGSGKQRGTTDGATVPEATQRLQDGLAGVADYAGDRNVTILPETLAPHLCDVLTSLDETARMVKEIDHPAVQTMFDTHNAVAETVPHDELIKAHQDIIRHVHINEMDGRHPGTGSYDFAVPLRGLMEVGYDGWLSLEVFQFEPSGEEIARLSSEYLRGIEARLLEG